MDTILQKIEKDNFIDSELESASNVLRRGGLVAFPTETVYGLGADGLDDKAAKKIYAAKGRPSDNPLIVHIASMDSLNELVQEIPEKALKLAEAFWPGPLTMIFKKSDAVPYGTTGGLDTVALRMPNHPLALALIRNSGVCIAAPSANTSGRPSPTKASHVVEDLSGKIDMILDGGDVGIGLESTIVDMTSLVPTILRPGYITKEMLSEVIGEVDIDQAILSCNLDPNLKPKAPGMKYKHYAPKGELIIIEGEPEKVTKEINLRTKKLIEQGKKVGILASEESKDGYLLGDIMVVGSRKEEISIAKGLYNVLREFDLLKEDYIFSESFEDDKLGQAIMNRLLKAAGYHVDKI